MYPLSVNQHAAELRARGGHIARPANQLHDCVLVDRLALAAKPAYPVALNNLAYALEKQLKLEEAKEAYEQVMALDASNKTARKRLKLLARKAGLDQSA